MDIKEIPTAAGSHRMAAIRTAREDTVNRMEGEGEDSVSLSNSISRDGTILILI